MASTAVAAAAAATASAIKYSGPTSGHSIHLLNHPSIHSIHLSIYSVIHLYVQHFPSFAPHDSSYRSHKYNFHQQTSIPPAAQNPTTQPFLPLLLLPFFILCAPIVNGYAIRPCEPHARQYNMKTVHIISASIQLTSEDPLIYVLLCLCPVGRSSSHTQQMFRKWLRAR